MIVVSTFLVLACVSIEILLAMALWVSAIYNSELVFLLALCSVPFATLFCLSVKALSTRLADYQHSYARADVHQPCLRAM
jgi:hypothetical protein